MSGQTITDYASLVQAVQDWLARSDITDASYAPEIIQMAQERIYHGFIDNKGTYWPGLRIRQMEKNFGSGLVSGITISAGGSGYAVSDTIAFDAAPAGGITATGTLVLTNGVITGLNVINPGLGYTTAPNVTITTSGGSGATISTIIATNGAQIGPIPNGNYAVPADYIDIKYMVLWDGSETARMQRQSASWIYQWYPDRTADNLPTYVGRDNDVFIFGPSPDSQYTITGVYYYKDAYLSSTYTTNWLTANYPRLILAASLAEAAVFTADMERTQYWETQYQNICRTLQVGETNEAYSGSPMVMTPV